MAVEFPSSGETSPTSKTSPGKAQSPTQAQKKERALFTMKKGKLVAADALDKAMYSRMHTNPKVAQRWYNASTAAAESLARGHSRSSPDPNAHKITDWSNS